MASTIRGSDNFDSSNKLTAGTAQATTAGTAIDFTGIPAWAKRITVMLNGVSTNGTSLVQIQLGSGSVTTSGYLGTVHDLGTSAVGAVLSNGFTVGAAAGDFSAASLRFGSVVLTNIGSNIWIAQGLFSQSTIALSCTLSGSITLAGALDRIRLTTVNGTDTFDAGSVNIMYE